MYSTGQIIMVCLLLGLPFLGWGQYGSQYSLYMHERYGFNPAFGGMERSLAIDLHYRTQWAGIAGNPESRALNVHLPFYIWQGGLGLQLFNESIGAESQNGFLASYNYIHETQGGLYSFGLRAGILQKTLDGTKLRAPDGTYEGSIIDHHDINLPNGVVSGVAPLLDAGFYYAGNYFEAGLSMTGWYPTGIGLGSEIHYYPEPTVHFFGEYFIESLGDVSLYPAVYIKSDVIQTQAEVSLRGEWQNVATAGVGYRGFGSQNLDALIFMAGVRLSARFYLHYSYDIGLSSLQSAHEGTHEILVKYNLGKTIGTGLPPRIIYNPRYL